MRLLIFISKFDTEDDLRGFFPRRVEELNKLGVFVTVLTQELGSFNTHHLLDVRVINKNVHSRKFKRLWLVIRETYRLRSQFESILVMMAPTWTVVFSLLSKFLRKKTFLWYAVWKGNWKLRVAEALVDRIFCSVPGSFPFKSKKISVIGQGIDTEEFAMNEGERPNSILALGRLSRVKKLEVLFRAVALLKKESPELTPRLRINVVGAPISAADRIYEDDLGRLTAQLEISDLVQWYGKIPHSKVSDFYKASDLWVNLTPTGSFDKTILEAMSSGCITLFSNQLVQIGELSKQLTFAENSEQELAEKLRYFLKMDTQSKQKVRNRLREYVKQNHSIETWSRRLIKEIEDRSK